jgi:hypothetical protein
MKTIAVILLAILFTACEKEETILPSPIISNDTIITTTKTVEPIKDTVKTMPTVTIQYMTTYVSRGLPTLTMQFEDYFNGQIVKDSVYTFEVPIDENRNHWHEINFKASSYMGVSIIITNGTDTRTFTIEFNSPQTLKNSFQFQLWKENKVSI